MRDWSIWQAKIAAFQEQRAQRQRGAAERIIQLDRLTEEGKQRIIRLDQLTEDGKQRLAGWTQWKQAEIAARSKEKGATRTKSELKMAAMQETLDKVAQQILDIKAVLSAAEKCIGQAESQLMSAEEHFAQAGWNLMDAEDHLAQIEGKLLRASSEQIEARITDEALIKTNVGRRL